MASIAKKLQRRDSALKKKTCEFSRTCGCNAGMKQRTCRERLPRKNNSFAIGEIPLIPFSLVRPSILPISFVVYVAADVWPWHWLFPDDFQVGNSAHDGIELWYRLLRGGRRLIARAACSNKSSVNWFLRINYIYSLSLSLTYNGANEFLEFISWSTVWLKFPQALIYTIRTAVLIALAIRSRLDV